MLVPTDSKMNRAAVALSIVLAAVIGALVYLHVESRQMEAEILRVSDNVERMLADGAQLRQQIQSGALRFLHKRRGRLFSTASRGNEPSPHRVVTRSITGPAVNPCTTVDATIVYATAAQS